MVQWLGAPVALGNDCPHGDSKAYGSPVLRDPTPSSGLMYQTQTWCKDMHAKKTLAK